MKIQSKIVCHILFCAVFLGSIFLLQHLIVYNPISSFPHQEQQELGLSRKKKAELKDFASAIDSRACKSFLYDVSEWTLQYWVLNKTIEDEKCKNISKELLKGNTVKRIIHKNGTIENRGCAKHTVQCNESAHFNFIVKKRVNTPPCCREKLLELLNHFSQELQRLHVSHMLAFGAVLGWARNGKMIPYDRDIDLIVDVAFWNTTLFFVTLKELEIRYGHKSVLTDNGKKLWISYSAINQNTIDVWPFEVIRRSGKCPTVSIPHWQWKMQPLENLFPERYVRFDNVWTFVPRNPISYLNILYKNWKRELDCSYIEDGKCSERPFIEFESRLVKRSTVVIAVTFIMLIILTCIWLVLQTCLQLV